MLDSPARCREFQPATGLVDHDNEVGLDRTASCLRRYHDAAPVAVPVRERLKRRRFDAHPDFGLARGRAVGHLIGEAVGAGVSRGRRVGHAAIGLQGDLAPDRQGERGEAKRVAVGVVVIGEGVERDRLPGAGYRIVDGHRCCVLRCHRHSNALPWRLPPRGP
jgi:hypothetical protein